MKAICTIAMMTLVAVTLQAQQTPYQVFFRNNWQAVNPAAIDRVFFFRTQPSILLSGSYRQQWLGTEEAPAYSFLSFENFIEDSGLRWGVSAFQDKAGPTSTVGMYGNLTQTISMGKGKFLSVGLNLGAIRFQIDPEKLIFDNKQAEQEAGTLDNLNRFFLDLSGGIFYRKKALHDNPDMFYTGLSIPQTITVNAGSRGNDGLFSTERIPHIYYMLGWYISPGNYDDDFPVDIEPTLWVRYVPGVTYSSIANNFPLSVDATVRAYFGNYRRKSNPFWVGAGYGTNTMMNMEVGYHWINPKDTEKSFRVGLGYSFPVGNRLLNLGHSMELTAAWAIY